MKEFFFKNSGFFRAFFHKLQKKSQRSGQKGKNPLPQPPQTAQKAADPPAGEAEIQLHPQQQEEQHEQSQTSPAGTRAQPEEGRPGKQAEEQVQQRGQEAAGRPLHGEEIVKQPRRRADRQGKPRLLQLQQRRGIRHPNRREKRPPRSARPSS